MKNQPKITVGIMDRQTEVFGRLDGDFDGNGFGPVSGLFSARPEAGMIALFDEANREACRSPSIRLTDQKSSTLRLHPGTKARSGQAFTLFNVTIGSRFHWERTEDQTFQGDLILRPRRDGTIAAINELPLEEYLKSVISSEMSGAAPLEFLKAHGILARSWLLAGLGRRRKKGKTSIPAGKIIKKEGEVIRWYDREDHDLFDVCADDHCQRYQGITKIVSEQAEKAVRATLGRVITYQDEICDARYSKACGGLTEEFGTAAEEKRG